MSKMTKCDVCVRRVRCMAEGRLATYFTSDDLEFDPAYGRGSHGIVKVGWNCPLESRDVLLSLKPEWFNPIMQGFKTIEVRKRAPLQKHPYKVYLYCTKGGEDVYRAGIIERDIRPYKMNGTVCGEFTCISTTEYGPSLSRIPGGTYLTVKQLYTYMGASRKLCFMTIKDPILYDTPLSLEDFGLTRAPQSWQYVERMTAGAGFEYERKENE